MSRAYSRAGGSKMGESTLIRQFLFSTLFSTLGWSGRIRGHAGRDLSAGGRHYSTGWFERQHCLFTSGQLNSV